MIQAGTSGWWRHAACALPSIQADVMMVAASADERRLQPHTCGDFETQDSAIEFEGSVQVSDLEMDMSNGHAGIN